MECSSCIEKHGAFKCRATASSRIERILSRMQSIKIELRRPWRREQPRTSSPVSLFHWRRIFEAWCWFCRQERNGPSFRLLLWKTRASNGLLCAVTTDAAYRASRDSGGEKLRVISNLWQAIAARKKINKAARMNAALETRIVRRSARLAATESA